MGLVFLGLFSEVKAQNRMPSPRLDSLFRDSSRIEFLDFRFDWVHPIEIPWSQSFLVLTEIPGDTFLLQVSNASQLLLARNTRSGPLFMQVEKNSVFPFRQLEAKVGYRLALVRWALPHGYLMARLLNAKGDILDEIYYCFSIPPKSLRFVRKETK